jgi:hypothetical protein
MCSDGWCVCGNHNLTSMVRRAATVQIYRMLCYRVKHMMRRGMKRKGKWCGDGNGGSMVIRMDMEWGIVKYMA